MSTDLEIITCYGITLTFIVVGCSILCQHLSNRARKKRLSVESLRATTKQQTVDPDYVLHCVQSGCNNQK